MSGGAELVYLSSDGEDSDSLSDNISEVVSREPTIVTDDYEGDSSPSDTDSSIDQPFIVSYGQNVFTLKNQAPGGVLIGLQPKQGVFISGIFQLQVIKGGITYNGIHYNASKNNLSMWHPLTNAIPEIKSSFYAGWNEPVNLTGRYTSTIDPTLVNDFACLLVITPSPIDGIMDIGKFYRDAVFLWKPRPVFNDPIQGRSDTTYALLDARTESHFIKQDIPTNWQPVLDELFMSSKNAVHDTRVMVIGGKNSGKSTFLRLLLEMIRNKRGSDEEYQSNQNEDSLYIDLDPGQPEYSDPDCLSLTEIGHNNTSQFGQHLAQHNYKTLKQYYYGSSSPQDEPELYMKQINGLLNYFEEMSFVGSTFLNLPGWIKGFGMTIVNHVIENFKPTHIICIDSSKLKEELRIPKSFSNSLQDNYTPTIRNIDSVMSHLSDNTLVPSNFNASQIRILKMIMKMHRINGERPNHLAYDFNPLITHAPMQISYNQTGGIENISFSPEFIDLEDCNIRRALEGTIVALSVRKEARDSDANTLPTQRSFPIITEVLNPDDTEYFSLCLVHSIDEKNKVMNIYLPQVNIERVIKESEKITLLNNDTQHDLKYTWMLTRSRSDVPFCELFPNNVKSIFSEYDEIPYISTERRKKYEHVWKVRKNVQRRGHFMK
ncbi:polynucleotide 5'-hydroxyl-kinase [Maudiozyma humilis]|uniref:Polynucleotide 5'-hydroxyl-kinase GRC3 n=1 Tax=Maudiozyma humilis TaxID=51915 RepID=A0AAV5RXN6_MAUHU|nr:polynucleotide 5'-hydroxyl-kinase [Kazachstania humilis]